MKGTALALALTFGVLSPAQADTLLLDAVSAAPPNSANGLLRPRSGATMAAVSARFGDPDSTREAVGDPPISRWIYPAYTVYFEFDRVINVVVHR